MAANLKLAEAFVDIKVNRSGLNSGIAIAILELKKLNGLGAVKLSLDRGAATSSLNLLRQQLNALKDSAKINVSVNRRVGGGGGGGGSGGDGFLGGMLQTAGGMLLRDLPGMAARGAMGIGEELFDAAKKASDLGESMSKVRVTFGSSSNDVISNTNTLADRFGVVKQEALDAAASFGLMGQAAGMSKAQSAALGNEFVRMGLDLASFHNISNEEAFTKLRSGLAGEIEPLRTIGILLSEDAVQAKALEMGLVATAKEAKHLSQAQKVEARTELIKDQMGPAAGDLERTADSAANQLRRLEGDLENAKVAMGEKLIPALVDGISLARELGSTFAEAFGTGPIDAMVTVIKTAIDTARLLNKEFNKTPMMIGPDGKPVKQTQENGHGDSWFGSIFTNPVPSDMQKNADELAGVNKGNAPAQTPATIRAKQLADVATAQAQAQAKGDAKLAERLQAKEDARMASPFMLRDPSGLDLANSLKPPGANNVPMLLRAGRPSDADIKGPEVEKEKKFSSQAFGDPADFAKSAIQAALSDKDDTPKRTLDETIRQTTVLQSVEAALNSALKMGGQKGVILRSSGRA